MLKKAKKSKSPGPNGSTIELFFEFFELIGEDMVILMEELRLGGRIPWELNATFIALISKISNHDTFDDFHPIVEILNNITLIHRDYPDYTLFAECMHNT